MEQAGASGIGTLAEKADGERIKVGGIVKGMREIESKRGRMAFVALEDLEGEVEVTVFADLFKRTDGFLVPGEKVLVEGRVNIYNDQKKIVANDVRSLTAAAPDTGDDPDPAPAPAPPPRIVGGLRIRLAAEVATADRLERIRTVLRAHPGDEPVRLHLRGADGRDAIIQAGPRFRVTVTQELIRALAAAGPDILVEADS